MTLLKEHPIIKYERTDIKKTFGAIPVADRSWRDGSLRFSTTV